MLRSMIQFNPSNRVTTLEALQHPFFDPIKQQGHVDTFRAHLMSLQQQSKNRAARAGSSAGDVTPTLDPIPMNADIEKMGESEEHLKVNVIMHDIRYCVQFIMYLFMCIIIYFVI